MFLPLHMFQWQHLRSANQMDSRLCWIILVEPHEAGLVWLTGGCDSLSIHNLVLTAPGVICDPACLCHACLASKGLLHQSDDAHSGGKH